MDSLYSQLRDRRIAEGLRELAEPVKPKQTSVAAIADSIDELDKLIAIHQKCSALLEAYGKNGATCFVKWTRKRKYRSCS